MYKRALLGIGLGVFLTHGASATPKNSSDTTDASQRSAVESGTHIHRGQTKTVRKPESPTSFRADDISRDIRSAGDTADERPSKSKFTSGSGSSSGSSYTSSGPSKSYYSNYSRSASESKVKVVTEGHQTGLAEYAIRAAVFGGSKGGTFEQERKLRELGRLIAKQKWPLLTGGGNGMPHVAQKAAFEAGGYTVGFGQSDSLISHRSSGRPTEHLSLLYATGTGRGPGTIEREAPLAEQTNVGFFAGGSIGTLGELVASLYKPGVLAFLKGSGGVADAAVKKILPFIGPLPSHVRVVEDSDPEHLVIGAMIALDELKGKVDFPKSQVKVGRRPVFEHPEMVRKNANVFTYLVDGQGMSASDKQKLKKLSSLINSEKIDGRVPVVIVPDREGLTADIATASAQQGVGTITISHLGPNRVEKAGYNHQRLYLNKGEGVGESAAGREVTQEARVVVVAGGDYKTLSGLIYALHHETLIAVLETGGMSGKLRSDIMPVIADKDTHAKIIYGSDPEELFAQIKRALVPPPPPPKIELPKYEYKKGSSSSSHDEPKSGFMNGGMDPEYDQNWE